MNGNTKIMLMAVSTWVLVCQPFVFKDMPDAARPFALITEGIDLAVLAWLTFRAWKPAGCKPAACKPPLR